MDIEEGFLSTKMKLKHHYYRLFSFFIGFAFVFLGAVFLSADVQWVLQSPLDYQVFQRQSRGAGDVLIKGHVKSEDAEGGVLQYRLVKDSMVDWQNFPADLENGIFENTVPVPSGGWYRLDLRVIKEDLPISEHVITHVGVGELFVVAGQSNAANHGEERMQTHTELVSTFDGSHWQLANDPQPGASGNRGSFLPSFGDEMVRRFQVPIGFVSCGIGATSVREWLPEDSRFPNPPTLIGRVEQLPNGEWSSKGEAYRIFVERMRSLRDSRFRAVLWHQGESDANQKDSTRTLSGNLYRNYLENIIRSSRAAIGWEVPWFVAQVSYHVPGDESSPDIRGAQASLWKDGIVFQGPDSDAIKGHYRERQGKGVHFSAEGLEEHARRWAEKVGPWLEAELAQ